MINKQLYQKQITVSSIVKKALVLFFSFSLVFLSIPLKSNAASPVTYTRSRPAGEYQHFRVTSGESAGAWGFCGDIFHGPPDKSGSAQSTPVSGADPVARVMYYWLVLQGWQYASLTANSGYGSPQMSYGAAMHYAICYARLQGGFTPAATYGGHTATASDFKTSFMGSKDGNDTNYDVVKAMYEIGVNNVAVAPPEFQVYFIDVANRNEQDAFVFRVAVDVNIVKSYSNPNVTSGNSLYSLNGINFALYPSPQAAMSNSGAVAVFTTNASGATQTISIVPGTYYLVELPSSNGLVVPSPLKAETGGYPLPIYTGMTIGIGDTVSTQTYNVGYTYSNANTLPQQVLATLPATRPYTNGTIATAAEPSSTYVTVGDQTYTFDGWDAPAKAVNGANVTFVGSWSIDIPEETNDDFRDLKVIYQYEDADNLPQEVLDTLPQDLDEHGDANIYEIGTTVTPLSPTQEQIIVGEDIYIFDGWDKASDTFENENIVFTGSWQKTRSRSVPQQEQEPNQEQQPDQPNDDMTKPDEEQIEEPVETPPEPITGD